MTIKLTFMGAAQNVTGSSYLLEANGSKILIDCGMYQERQFKFRNYEPFAMDVNSIDAVLLTHAHLDHCGRVPKLVKEGFHGRVIATPATLEIARIIMLDSAFIQEEDLKWKKKRHKKEGRKSPFPYKPLYIKEDVLNTEKLFEKAPYKTPISLGSGISASFFEAGHIFGSSMIKISIKDDNETKTILFSGDVGRWNVPIIEDPTQFEQADYVLIESTYGDRTHGEVSDIPLELERIINETYNRGGNIIIPSFAVERTQELLYHLNNLVNEKKIPRLMTFVDSPMAIKVTEIFSKHEELFDSEAMEHIESGDNPVDFPGLTMTRSTGQSKGINHIKGVSIIIAGSGMCTGGRVKHHLMANIMRPESTILFVGYQANGTLGRHILEKPETVRIFGKKVPLRATVEKISGFSGHADKNELYRWISSLKTPPKKVFVVHGEEHAAASFRDFLEEKTSWNCYVPTYLETVEL